MKATTPSLVFEELKYIINTWTTTIPSLCSSCALSVVVHYLRHWEERSLRKIKKNRMVEKDSKVIPYWTI